MPDKPTTEAWSRLPKETESEYLYFKAWLTRIYVPLDKRKSIAGNMVGRSIEDAARYLGADESVLRVAAQDNSWSERAVAYDNHLIHKEVEGRIDSLEEMRIQQSRVIQKAMALLEGSIAMFTDLVEEKNLEKLAAARLDIPRLMDQVLHYQRLLYGESTENTNIAATVEFGAKWDLSVLNDEEFGMLIRIREKLKRAKLARG